MSYTAGVKQSPPPVEQVVPQVPAKLKMNDHPEAPLTPSQSPAQSRSPRPDAASRSPELRGRMSTVVVEPIKDQHEIHHEDPMSSCLHSLHWAQQNAVPVLTGLVLALLLANTIKDDYKYYFTADTCSSTGNATEIGGHRRLLRDLEACVHNHLDRWTMLDCPVFGHNLTLHFVANDIIMAFFFGLAMKEVVEALLPGGSLNPPSKAINPLLTTLGGVLGPVAVYFIFLQIFFEMGLMDDYGMTLSDYQKGWGIVTATDIVLAWLVARLIFGQGHPAIDYLLLLAVADDALGMVIIACFYPDEAHPVEPVYLLITALGMACSYIMRKFYYRKEHAHGAGHIQSWIPYIFIGGTLSWIGFIKAHLHPALSLCAIIPFMPTAPHHGEEDEASSEELEKLKATATDELDNAVLYKDYATAASKTEDIEDLEHLIDMAKRRESADSEMAAIMEKAQGRFQDLSVEEQATVIDDYIKEQEDRTGTAKTLTRKLGAGYLFAAYRKVRVKDDHGLEHHQLSTLDAFEHSCKVYVDFGLALFAFVNAGIVIESVGAMAILIPLSLLVGKFLGIIVMYKIAFKLGFRPPLGIHTKHIAMIGVVASIGLVVAIFVSDVAFTDEKLKGDAKLGAILSAFPCPIIAVILTRFFKFDDAEDAIRTAAEEELTADSNEVFQEPASPRGWGANKPKRAASLNSEFGNVHTNGEETAPSTPERQGRPQFEIRRMNSV